MGWQYNFTSPNAGLKGVVNPQNHFCQEQGNTEAYAQRHHVFQKGF
jgi:putative hemolysin